MEQKIMLIQIKKIALGCGYAQLTCLVPSHFQVYLSIVPSFNPSSFTPHKTRKEQKERLICSQFLENCHTQVVGLFFSSFATDLVYKRHENLQLKFCCYFDDDEK